MVQQFLDSAFTHLHTCRVTVLQDMAVLTDLYPDFPLWRERFTKHLINSLAFQHFRERMRSARQASDAAMNRPLNQQTVNAERVNQVKVQQHYQAVISKLQNEKAQGIIQQLANSPSLDATVSFLHEPAAQLQEQVSTSVMSDVQRQLSDLSFQVQQMMRMMAIQPQQQVLSSLIQQQPGTSQSSMHHVTAAPAPTPMLTLSNLPGPDLSSPTPERKREIADFIKGFSNNPKAVQFATGQLSIAAACDAQTRVSQRLPTPQVPGLQAHGSPLHSLLTALSSGSALPRHSPGEHPHSRRRLGFDQLQQPLRLQLGGLPQPTTMHAAAAVLQQNVGSSRPFLGNRQQAITPPLLPNNNPQQRQPQQVETFSPLPPAAPYMVPGSLVRHSVLQAAPNQQPPQQYASVHQSLMVHQSRQQVTSQDEDTYTPLVPRIAYAVPGSLVPTPPAPSIPRPPKYEFKLLGDVAAAWREWWDEVVPRDAVSIKWRTKSVESGLSLAESTRNSQKHSRLHALIEYVEARAAATGSSLLDAVDNVEQERIHETLTMTKLIDKIVAIRTQAKKAEKVAKAAAGAAPAPAAEAP